MRTLKNLPLTLIFVIAANALTHSAIFGEENFSKRTSLKKPCDAALYNKHYVHASLRNGKIIPDVMLPVVIISAERNKKNIVPAIEKGNTIIGVVDLPEIVITGERKTSGSKLRTIAGKNGITPVMDLTEVVIAAEKIKSNSFAWQVTNENKIPVVNLPEIIISADFYSCDMLPTVLYKGKYIASVNLPEVEITADKPENLIISSNDDRSNQQVDFSSDYFGKVETKANQNLSIVIFILAKTFFLKF